MTNGTDDSGAGELAGRRALSGQRHGLDHAAASGALSRPLRPFNGLTVPGEVTVSRQILAEPSAELSDRTWARLADGTPLVTAEHSGQGWIVLFHITASPAWSSLPLSGLYVDMLKRLLALSAGTPARDAGRADQPAAGSLLDGFGRLEPPTPDIAPIAARDFERTDVSTKHPPGPLRRAWRGQRAQRNGCAMPRSRP